MENTMEYNLKHGNAEKQESNCVVVAVYSKQTLSQSAKRLDDASDGYIKKILKDNNFTADPSETIVLFDVKGVSAKRIILLGCGDAKKVTPSVYEKIITGCANTIQKNNIKDFCGYLSEIDVEKRSTEWKVRDFIIKYNQAYYSFDEFKSKDKKTKYVIPKVSIFVNTKSELTSCQDALKQGIAISGGMNFKKDLANSPANICTPTYLAQQAKKLAKTFTKISTSILSEKDMQELSMGSLLSVTQGSATPAKFITMEYSGGDKKDAPYVLVGKGITFDTGGNSLKPPAGMIGMKYDMCGGASVFGIMQAVAELKLKINLIGVVPACENTPGGSASRPDDIVTSMSGQTIEILNTDAEGRLILADALTYVERYKPKVVIDMATLTGACVVALGNLATAVMSNQDKLAKDLLKASEDIFDRAWELPLWDEYHDQLKSPFADMKNIGDGGAGTITAGCFLAKFASKYNWAHLDIAGSAAQFSGPNRCASGRPVPMVVQYLINQSKA
jgi:leucyl aminopeptidase